MSVAYVPLRVFSSFTMLEGAIEPKAIAKQAAKLGFPAVGLTDRNGLYAAAREMKVAMMRTAASPIIHSGGDASAAIFDASCCDSMSEANLKRVRGACGWAQPSG